MYVRICGTWMSVYVRVFECICVICVYVSVSMRVCFFPCREKEVLLNYKTPFDKTLVFKGPDIGVVIPPVLTV